jgi:hypothetical protein
VNFEERLWYDTDVIVPVQAVFLAQVVFDGISECEAEFEHFSFSLAELGRGERWCWRFSLDDIILGWKGYIDPYQARKIANLDGA